MINKRVRDGNQLSENSYVATGVEQRRDIFIPYSVILTSSTYINDENDRTSWYK